MRQDISHLFPETSMQDPHSSRSVNYYRSTHFEKHSPYNKSAVTSREDRCNPNTCNAKVGTDLRPEFDSRYNIRHFVSSEIQELKETVQDIDESRQHEKSVMYRQCFSS